METPMPPAESTDYAADGIHRMAPREAMSASVRRLRDTYAMVPGAPLYKREFGYYVLPILHDGRFVGRLDPKLHRDGGILEIKSLHLEEGFDGGRGFLTGLRESLAVLAEFAGADDLKLPRGWKGKLS